MKYLVLTFLVSFHSLASFQNLVKEFAKNNNDLEILELEMERAKISSEDFDGGFDWNLNFSVGTEDSFPAGFFDFQAQNTIASFASLGLTKNFSWGGQFSFTNTFLDYDLSNWTRNAPFEAGAEVRNVFSYTQDLGKDFLGGATEQKEMVSKTSYELAKVVNDISRQQKYFDFFNTYLIAKLQKTIVQLNKEALERQEKRYRTIAKKYRDGISQKIDKLQSQMALETQRTQLKQIQSKFLGDKNTLANFLQRGLGEGELKTYNLDEFSPVDPVKGSVESTLSYMSSLKESQLAGLNEEIAKKDKRPNFSLTASYSLNAINSEAGDAFSDAAPGGDRREIALTLNYSMPLGNTVLKNQYAKTHIDKLKANKKLETVLKNTKLNLELLSQRISILRDKLELEANKLKVAKMALRENNRLYNLGKTEIELVLSSEESLINSELSMAQSLFEYDLLLAQDALTKGKVTELIKDYEAK